MLAFAAGPWHLHAAMEEGTRPSVLLVEDDAEVRSSVAEILELEGFAVETAVHGQQALDKLRSGACPNVMLLDLMMPVMNGLELLEHPRAAGAVARGHLIRSRVASRNSVSRVRVR